MGPNGNMLNEEQMNQLGALMEQADAANPEPMDEEPEMEEAVAPDEVDTINDNSSGISEGDGTASDEDVAPDPNAGNPQALAETPLPEGFKDVGQLIAAYNELKGQSDQRGNEMEALRDLNGQLVAIAEALGYGQDLQSVDLSVDESLAESDPKAYARQMMKKEIADQFRPLLETQQKNLRGRMIDASWKNFAREHEDIADLMDDIKAVIGESPELTDNERGMEVAYHMARSRRYQPRKALLDDDAFVQEAANNPKIRDKVIEAYLKEIGKGKENAPASVGNGGKAVPVGQKKHSMEEAHNDFRKLLGL